MPKAWSRVADLVREAFELSGSLPQDEKERAALAVLTLEVSKASRRRLQEQLKVCRRLVMRSAKP